MPKRDGFETAKAIKKAYPDIKIIILTMEAYYRKIMPLKKKMTFQKKPEHIIWLRT